MINAIGQHFLRAKLQTYLGTDVIIKCQLDSSSHSLAQLRNGRLIYVGYNRLSIVDEEGSHEVLYSELIGGDPRNLMIYDRGVYNYIAHGVWIREKDGVYD